MLVAPRLQYANTAERFWGEIHGQAVFRIATTSFLPENHRVWLPGFHLRLVR